MVCRGRDLAVLLLALIPHRHSSLIRVERSMGACLTAVVLGCVGCRRQVVTFHNQRDFMFVRHHRYMFDRKEDKGIKARLQVRRLSCHVLPIPLKSPQDVAVIDMPSGTPLPGCHQYPFRSPVRQSASPSV